MSLANGFLAVRDCRNSNGRYLVYRPHYYGGECGESAICYFDGQNTWHDADGVDFDRLLKHEDVLAWCELPAPYTEGE